MSGSKMRRRRTRRGLLADRFKLKVDGERRVRADRRRRGRTPSDGKLGPKLWKTIDDCEKIQEERLRAAKAARGSQR